MQMCFVRFGLPRLHSQNRPNGLRGSVGKAEIFLPVHRGKQGNVKLWCESKYKCLLNVLAEVMAFKSTCRIHRHWMNYGGLYEVPSSAFITSANS